MARDFAGRSKSDRQTSFAFCQPRGSKAILPPPIYKSGGMNPESVRTADDARKIVEERKLDHIKVGVFDNDGVMRGKYMGRDKFLSALAKGFGFCDVVLG